MENYPSGLKFVQATVAGRLVGATAKMTEKDLNCSLNQTGERENIGIPMYAPLSSTLDVLPGFNTQSISHYQEFKNYGRQ